MSIVTLNDFIKTHNANLGEPFAHILSQIAKSGEEINKRLSRNGLTPKTEDSGTTNIYGENVHTLDIYANRVITQLLLSCEAVHAVGSEELDQPKVSDHEGEYIVVYDPLDGSSNIDTNLPVGTIFGIFPKSSSLLQKGSSLVAAGYILYGPSMMLVLSTPTMLNGFTYDSQTGGFILSYPKIRIGSQKIYAINEGNWELFSNTDRAYITAIKKESVYSLRYTGSMVADIHRILFNGGIFIYPADSKHRTGKLRLLYEVAPLSFLMAQAGGAAQSNGVESLELMPQKHDQRVPVAMGSNEEVRKYGSFHR